MIDAAADETPRDPRLLTLAHAVATGNLIAPSEGGPSAASSLVTTRSRIMSAQPAILPRPEGDDSIEARARRIYRWVLSNVEAGRETDGRRAVMGRSGNRSEAFVYLCRLNGIAADFGLIRDRLAPAAVGPMSEVESFSTPAVRLTTAKGPLWMLVHDRFAPFGYLPDSLRGQPAVVLTTGAPQEVTVGAGIRDGVTHDGRVDLAADGAARLEIEQRYEGKFAIVLRTALGQLSQARFREAIESRLVPQLLPGAHLIDAKVVNLGELDEPLVLRLTLEMATFARLRGRVLQIPMLFPVRLGPLVSLPSRETPLYLSEVVAGRVVLRLRINLPPGARVGTSFHPITSENQGRLLRINDRVEGSTIVLDRLVDIPAGRVAPAEYNAFQAFSRMCDAALHRDVVITLDDSK